MARRTAPAAFLAAILALPAGLAAAESTSPAPAPDPEELRLPQALDRACREMMQKMKPALDDALDYMRGFSGVDDPRNYELPEVLPNGDIIIRRRDDAPPFDPDLDEGEEDPAAEEGIRT